MPSQQSIRKPTAALRALENESRAMPEPMATEEEVMIREFPAAAPAVIRSTPTAIRRIAT
jgi:hypothetical protein